MKERFYCHNHDFESVLHNYCPFCLEAKLTKERDELRLSLIDIRADLQRQSDANVKLAYMNDGLNVQLARCVCVLTYFADAHTRAKGKESWCSSYVNNSAWGKARDAVDNLPKSAHLDAEILKAAEKIPSILTDNEDILCVRDIQHWSLEDIALMDNFLATVRAKQE